MKVLLGVFVLLCVGSAFCDDTAKNKIMGQVKSEALKKYLEQNDWLAKAETKLDEICPGATAKLVPGIETLMECEEATEEQTMCTAIRTSGMNCTAPLLKVAEECMPEASKGMPTLLAKSIISGVNYACQRTGEELLELMNDCVLNMEHANAERECMKKTEEKIKEMMKEPPTVTGMCQVMKEMKPCWTTHVNAVCKNSVAKKVFPGMMEALMAPCNA